MLNFIRKYRYRRSLIIDATITLLVLAQHQETLMEAIEPGSFLLTNDRELPGTEAALWLMQIPSLARDMEAEFDV